MSGSCFGIQRGKKNSTQSLKPTTGWKLIFVLIASFFSSFSPFFFLHFILFLSQYICIFLSLSRILYFSFISTPNRGAQSCVVAFSLTDRKSFEAVESWLRKVVDEIGEGVPTTLVLNKMDMAGSGVEQVTLEEAEKLASKLRLPLYKISVKNDHNVDKGEA